MRVYELSNKFNVSDKDLIKVIKTLKIRSDKEIDSFTTLTMKEAKAVEKHFSDKTKKKSTEKEVKAGDGELLILKKPEVVEKIKEKPNKDSSKLVEKTIEKVSETKKIEKPRKVVKVIRKTQDKEEKEPVKAKVTSPKSEKVVIKARADKIEKIEEHEEIAKTATQTVKVESKSVKKEFKKEEPKKEDAGKLSRKKDIRKRPYYDRDDDDSDKINRLRKPSKKIKEKIHSSVPESIKIMETITVAELSKKLNIKAGDVIQRLIKLGVMATINQVIDADTATLVSEEYGCKVITVSLYDETIIEEIEDKTDDLQPRPPIVTVMGHVDHGKTKLLDAIRESDVAATESGGITQHIGAYEISTEKGKIVFLDTPGHEAFTAMRARGAKVTDIVVLVVAADDGVMPQTIEAISHAREAKVPITVAINKVDSNKANVERVKQQLAELDLLPEDWGGKTIVTEVSALKKLNIDKLLENILLEAEFLELKANPNRMASGTIIESRIDIGRGPVATVLVQNGTLKVGDSFVSGVYSGKVRALFNDKGDHIDMATPSTAVEVLGLDGVPEAGDPFNVVENEKASKQIAIKRQDLHRISRAKDVKKVTLDDLSRQIREGEVKELKIILKGDVQGSIEALKDSLEKISNTEVAVKVIHSSTGAINENDVMLASASSAIILGFHVRPNTRAMLLAQREHVEIRKHSIIYDAINSIRNAVEGLLAPELREEINGQAEVREIFKVPKIGLIAGCYVTDGKIVRNQRVRLIRDGIEIYEGDILALKRFKEDTNEVKSGFECGISIHNFQDIKVGDVIESFYIKEVSRTLN